MKKQFNKKLVLNKNTIADLNNDEMIAILGGIEETNEWTICKTRCATNCVSCETIMHRTCDC